MEALSPPITSAEKANQVEHFPSNEGAFELASALEAKLESFKTGEIVLRQLSTDQMRILLGINSDGESVETGFRFNDEDKKIESNPNFAGKNPLIDKDDPSDTSRGVAKISTPSGDHNLNLLIEKYNLGSNGIEYSLKLIPDVTMDESLRHLYLDLVSKNLKKSVSV